MAGHDGVSGDICPKCGSPSWESCGKSHLDMGPCLRVQNVQIYGMPKATPLKVSGDDLYTRFGQQHGMSRGEAKLYVLGQIYGKDYDPGDAKNEALREEILAALHGREAL